MIAGTRRSDTNGLTVAHGRHANLKSRTSLRFTPEHSHFPTAGAQRSISPGGGREQRRRPARPRVREAWANEVRRHTQQWRVAQTKVAGVVSGEAQKPRQRFERQRKTAKAAVCGASANRLSWRANPGRRGGMCPDQPLASHWAEADRAPTAATSLGAGGKHAPRGPKGTLRLPGTQTPH